MRSLLGIVVLTVQLVSAHFYIDQINGGADGLRPISSLGSENFPVSGNDIIGDNMICNSAKPFSSYATNPVTVSAGSTVSVHWTNGPGNTSPIGAAHYGACMVYLGQGLKPSGWTKIYETTPDNSGDWCLNIIANNNNIYTFKIPTALAPGNYVVRIHLAALHAAGSAGGAQFYVRCMDIIVTGSGNSVPPFSDPIPGTWDLNTPGNGLSNSANNKIASNGASYANYYPAWGGTLWSPSSSGVSSVLDSTTTAAATTTKTLATASTTKTLATTSTTKTITTSSSIPTSSTQATQSPVPGVVFSDGFENGLGSWTVTYPSCSGSGSAEIDTTVSYSGKNSLKINGGGGFCNHVFVLNTAIANIRPIAYIRFFVRHQTAMPTNHHTFITMTDANDGNNDLRLGGQNSKLSWNRQSDDATCPSQSPTGIAASVTLPTNKWTCMELEIDTANGYLFAWMDGNTVSALTVQNGVADIDAAWKSSKPSWKPSPQNLKLGWESYGSDADTYWYDDVAIGSSRIGCGSTPPTSSATVTTATTTAKVSTTTTTTAKASTTTTTTTTTTTSTSSGICVAKYGQC
ncbi:hypothetical protein HK096_004437, partial [Nowakowskiella sp. JEL0078]